MNKNKIFNKIIVIILAITLLLSSVNIVIADNSTNEPSNFEKLSSKEKYAQHSAQNAIKDDIKNNEIIVKVKDDKTFSDVEKKMNTKASKSIKMRTRKVPNKKILQLLKQMALI